MSELRIGLMGAGQMGRALARGFVAAGLVAERCLVAHDPLAAAGQQLVDELPAARLVASNQEVVAAADVVLLAVKPQTFSAVTAGLAELPSPGPLFVSIVAGVPLERLCEELGTQRVIRVMANTPCLVGCGAAAYALAGGARDDDARLVQRLFESVGTAVRLDEELLDAVTGLSGSGPAYVYTMIEALSDGGVRMGLPRATATALAAQTVLGAARMVLDTAEHPAVLKDRVTSPGGTTIAGLQILERYGLRSALMDAVEAATVRSEELGQS